MHDHPEDIAFALGLALKCSSIQPFEEREMRSLIATHGLFAFEQLLKMREHGAAPDEEEHVATCLGVTKEWVAKRLA